MPTQTSRDQSTSVRIAVIAGSTRPVRRSPAIARWVTEEASVDDVQLDLIDLVDIDLPLLSERIPAVFGHYESPQTRAWSQLIDAYDAYVLVSPEYNASTSAALKNALDHLYAEWHDKAVAFVGYGMSGGVRAVEHLRGITAELRMAGVPRALHLQADQVVDDTFQAQNAEPADRAAVINDLAHWARALRALRDSEAAS